MTTASISWWSHFDVCNFNNSSWKCFIWTSNSETHLLHSFAMKREVFEQITSFGEQQQQGKRRWRTRMEKSKRILQEFSSPVFRLNSTFFCCLLQYIKRALYGSLMMLKKDFVVFFLEFFPSRFHKMIMMIEEMDFKRWWQNK